MFIEKFSGTTPDGQQQATWYRIPREATLELIRREIVPLQPGKTLEDIEDSEIMAFAGKETQVEGLIESWGLKIRTVGKG